MDFSTWILGVRFLQIVFMITSAMVFIYTSGLSEASRLIFVHLPFRGRSHRPVGNSWGISRFVRWILSACNFRYGFGSSPWRCTSTWRWSDPWSWTGALCRRSSSSGLEELKYCVSWVHPPLEHDWSPDDVIEFTKLLGGDRMENSLLFPHFSRSWMRLTFFRSDKTQDRWRHVPSTVIACEFLDRAGDTISMDFCRIQVLCQTVMFFLTVGSDSALWWRRSGAIVSWPIHQELVQFWCCLQKLLSGRLVPITKVSVFFDTNWPWRAECGL